MHVHPLAVSSDSICRVTSSSRLSSMVVSLRTRIGFGAMMRPERRSHSTHVTSEVESLPPLYAQSHGRESFARVSLLGS